MYVCMYVCMYKYKYIYIYGYSDLSPDPMSVRRELLYSFLLVTLLITTSTERDYGERDTYPQMQSELYASRPA